MRYGTNVLGTTSTELARIRRFACAVQGEMRRRSPFARLKMAKYDPAMQLAIDPIVDWARAVWDSLVSADDLFTAWRTASTKVGLSKRPFSVVTGPGGATIASARRIGWTVPSPRCLCTDDGEILDLTDFCQSQHTLDNDKKTKQVQPAVHSWSVVIDGTNKPCLLPTQTSRAC